MMPYEIKIRIDRRGDADSDLVVTRLFRLRTNEARFDRTQFDRLARAPSMSVSNPPTECLRRFPPWYHSRKYLPSG